eukprot:5967768-Amphidinium_carterae.1
MRCQPVGVIRTYDPTKGQLCAHCMRNVAAGWKTVLRLSLLHQSFLMQLESPRPLIVSSSPRLRAKKRQE